MRKNIKNGEVIVPAGVDVWEHEFRIAKILADAGHKVEFIPASNTSKTPDVYVDSIRYEMKSPTGSNIKSIERNLKRANRQAENIIITTYRVKHVQDRSVQSYLRQKIQTQKSIKKLLFINRGGEVIDIKSLL